jgi:hypothetical protein
MKFNFKNVIGIILATTLLIIECSCSKRITKDEFEVIINTDAIADSLFMGPSFVSKVFLDSAYSLQFRSTINNRIVKFSGSKPSHPVMFEFYVKGKGLSENFFIDLGI